MIRIKFKHILFLVSLFYGVTLAKNQSTSKKEIMEVDTTGLYLFNLITEIEPQISKNPEEAIHNINDLIPLSIKQNLYRETAYCYMLMGRSYKNLQKPTIALQYLKLAKGQLKKINIPLILKLEDYQKQDQPPKRKYRRIELNYCIELEFHIVPIVFYSDWAEIYAQLGEYDSANEIYAILNLKISNSLIQDNFDYKAADNYFNSNQFLLAIDVYNRLLIKEKHNNQNLNIRNCYRRIADCYFQLGDTKKAQEYHALANNEIDQTVTDSTFFVINADGSPDTSSITADIFTTKQLRIRNEILNDKNLNSLEYLKSANRYYKKEEFDKAVRAVDKYFSKISYALFINAEIEIIKDLAHHLNKSNNQQKALQYFVSYEQLRDTIKSHQLKLNYENSESGASSLGNTLNANELQRNQYIDKNEIIGLKTDNENSNQIILILALGLVLVTIGIFYLRHISKQRKVANQQLALRSLRSQMNPHFIFNALNSVNSFISLNDERAANSFLSEFSSLMRSVMENSEYDFIPLSKELEIINIYLELEHHRFKDKFTFTLDIDADLDEDEFKLPPMLIQPYIENAIWHGLRYKKEMGLLKVSIKNDGGNLLVTVIDDGIGREKSKEYKTNNQKKNKSIALKNIKHRIQIFEDLHKIKITEEVSDLDPDKADCGTMIILTIPQK